jgi:glycosyltransferase involved in cell wall biosynthesis
MTICIIGPGIMQIPPSGWGAVEILIWDYKQVLEKMGHSVFIINTPNRDEIISQCNLINPDFVHIQYDDFFDIVDYIKCNNIAITSHYGYLEQPDKFGGYSKIFNGFLKLKRVKIFALSDGIAEMYRKNGFDSDRIFVVPNGVRGDLFSFSDTCEYTDKSIYLAKIDYRKRQHLFHNIDNLYFAGNISQSTYNMKNYLGEWGKEYLYKNLTKYANLVLLSDGEAHPLVCLEAMSAGLGLVLSEYATANLDLSLPFIDVIPESKISDISYVSDVIRDNRIKSISMRDSIRNYVINNFVWDGIIKTRYLPIIEFIKKEY